MSISRSAVGSYVRGTNTTITPTISGYAVGDALLYVTQEFAGSQTIADPPGWTRLSADVNCHQIVIFGRIALTTNETIPGVAWGTGSIASAVVVAYTGVDPTFTTTTGAADRSTNITHDVTANASLRLPTANNSLCFFAGARNKTTTLNGTTFVAPTNFTMVTQDVPTGNSQVCSAISEFIQISATTIPAFTTMTTTSPANDASNQTAQGTMIFLASAPPPSGGGGAPVTFPPPKRRKTIVYDYYYPR